MEANGKYKVGDHHSAGLKQGEILLTELLKKYEDL